MESGKQPCEDFNPGPGSESMYNYHECPGCPGTRRWCVNCSSDHHSSGWDTCFAHERAARVAAEGECANLKLELSNLEMRIVANAGNSLSAGPALRWAHVKRATGYGRTMCREMCTKYGRDPDEMVPGEKP
jgi:hypothetical protein